MTPSEYKVDAIFQKNMYEVFISYASEDRNIAELIFYELRMNGWSPWIDNKKILPGEFWGPAIDKAIDKADFFVVILSFNSYQKRGVFQKEIKQAISKWQEKIEGDIYIIPVKVDAAPMPDSLKKIHFIDINKSGWQDLLLASLDEGVKRKGQVSPGSVNNEYLWNGEYLKNKARFSLFDSYKYILYENKTRSKLHEVMSWSESDISRCISVLRELALNAFEHGCAGDGDEEIEIKIDFSKLYKCVIIRVISPGKGFDLYKELNKEEDLLSDRGRGLMIANSLSQSLIADKSGRNIQAVIGEEEAITISDDSKIEKGYAIIKIGPTLDFRIADEFKNHMRRYYIYNCVNFILDCSETKVLDSTGMGSIYAVYRDIFDLDGTICFANATGLVERTLILARTHKVFKMFNSLDEAKLYLESLS